MSRTGYQHVFSLALIGLSLFMSQAHAISEITVCTDTNFWYPFTYVEDGKAAGIHIDIIRNAFETAGYHPHFYPMPWKDCLQSARNGKVDAVVSTSYQEERALYLNYPEGAAVDRQSPWRVGQIGYRVITSSTLPNGNPNPYQFKGRFDAVLNPVRVPAHYSVAKDLRAEGLVVSEGKNSIKNLYALIAEQNGSVVDIQEVVNFFQTHPEFSNKLVVQRRALYFKSYFLGFSNKSKLTIVEDKRFWQ